MSDPLVIFFGLLALASLAAIVWPFVRDWVVDKRPVIDLTPFELPSVVRDTRQDRTRAFELIEELRGFFQNDAEGLKLINDAGKRLFDQEQE